MGWFLVQTKSRSEEIAEKNLINQDFKIYCPRININTAKGFEVQIMFPGYIFIDLDLDSHWNKIRCTKGVIGLVRFTDYPLKIQNGVIEEIMESEKLFNSYQEDYFKPGEVVRIKAGNFSGLQAVYQESHGEKRAYILLDILGKMTRVSLGKEQIEKI